MRKYVKINGKIVVIKVRAHQVEKTKVISCKKIYNRNKYKKIDVEAN